MDKQNICATCGTRYAQVPVANCKICEDDRQYIKESGQEWISLSEIRNKHCIKILQLAANVFSLEIVPSFAISQRALLLLSPAGNILWDCIPLMDEPTIAFIKSKGGLKGIAISHPHYYSLMNEWASVFDCPIYLHQKDEEWICDHKDEHLVLWNEKEKELWNGMKLIHIGGHFPGSALLHAPHFSHKGTLFTGDSIYISRDRKQLSCMYSYPNYIPLPENAIRYVVDQVMPLHFDTMFGGFGWMNIYTEAKSVFENSMKRYLSIFQ